MSQEQEELEPIQESPATGFRFADVPPQLSTSQLTPPPWRKLQGVAKAAAGVIKVPKGKNAARSLARATRSSQESGTLGETPGSV